MDDSLAASVGGRRILLLERLFHIRRSEGNWGDTTIQYLRVGGAKCVRDGALDEGLANLRKC
jgi:hypothetical protein